jgi:hypothetical protein
VLGGDAGIGGGFLNFLAVFVGAGEEGDVVAVEALKRAMTSAAIEE